MNHAPIERMWTLSSSLLLNGPILQEFLHGMRTKDGLRRVDTLVSHLLLLVRWDSHYHPLNASHLLLSYVLRHVVCYLHNLLLFLGSKLWLALVLG